MRLPPHTATQSLGPGVLLNLAKGGHMASDDLAFIPKSDLSVAIRTKRVSPVEAVEAVLDRIQRLNPRLNAYCRMTEESARQEAQAAEAAVMRGERRPPLEGPRVSIPLWRIVQAE